jgi:hypothetical protein
MLNQTNVDANNNKYYRIQLLEKGGNFFCWTHWGRVGKVPGQNAMLPAAGGSQDEAEANFAKKFKDKTGVALAARDSHDWTPKVGKYTLVETEGGGDDQAPLGKLTVSQIEKGQKVLQQLSSAVKKKGSSEISTLSSQFYTLIPHDFGFKVPPAINTQALLTEKDELLKFYLRMGFDTVDVGDDKTPIDGIMAQPCPATLSDSCKSCKVSKSELDSSDQKGKEHASKQSGGPIGVMGAPLYAAIMLYTSNAIYRDLHTALRSEDRGKIQQYRLYLRLLMEALKGLPPVKRTLWRGISVDLYDQYKVGKTITWWGVSSCTADRSVAQNFAGGCGGSATILTVEAKTATDISQITFFSNEKENLVAPGTMFKVIKAEKKGKITEITIREEGRALN